MNKTNSTAKPTILITGASGQSGSHIINECIQQGFPVRALVRNAEKVKHLQLHPTIDIYEGDMLHPASLSSAMEGVDRVLLISSSNEKMVETQCSFIDACLEAGVPHVIKFSGEESQIGYNPKNFRFTREHEQIEEYLESSGLPWTHLRPSQFMQVYLREAVTIRNKGTLCLPLENINMSPVANEDIAKIAVALLQQGGHQSDRLRITGAEALSMATIAAIIGKVIGKPVHYVNVSPQERKQTLLEAGLPPYLVDAITDQGAERRRNPEAFVDLSTHQLFGVKPTCFEEFITRNAAAFYPL